MSRARMVIAKAGGWGLIVKFDGKLVTRVESVTFTPTLVTVKSMDQGEIILSTVDVELEGGVPTFDFEQALAEAHAEMIQKTIAQQEAKIEFLQALKDRGLPIPPDLEDDLG